MGSRCLFPNFCIIISRRASLTTDDIVLPNHISVMEKTKHQWRIVAPDYEPTNRFLSFFDLTCCPCGGYSRMSTHVKSITGGVPIPVENEDGFWTKDCFKFLACLPFYSCLVGKLHKDFRAAYNIDGSGCMDWLQSCCCPTGTVTRMEVESTLREEERRLVKHLPATLEETDSVTSIAEPYKNAAPMVYPKPVIDQIKESEPKVPPPIRKSTSRSQHSDHDVTVLTTIPETAAAAPVLDVQPATPIKSKRQHSLADDAQVPVGSNSKPWPLLKYLGQK